MTIKGFTSYSGESIKGFTPGEKDDERTDTYEYQKKKELESRVSAEEQFEDAQGVLKTGGEILYNIGKGALFLTTGSTQAGSTVDALRNKLEGKNSIPWNIGINYGPNDGFGDWEPVIEDVFSKDMNTFHSEKQTIIPKYSSGDIVQTEDGPLYRAKDIVSDVFFSTNNNNKKANTGWNIGQGSSKLTAPQYVDREMQRVGARKVNGRWVITEAIYSKLTDAQKRNIIQIVQTDINQTVPYSFKNVGEQQTPQFNAKYADYLTKYKGQPELHHLFPSALSSRFYFDVEYMGDEWTEMTAIAAEYGNYPGQPIAEGINNLETYPSIKRGESGVPPHLHNIIHNEILTNEIGQRGQKFFTKERLARMKSGREGKMEVWREWNQVIKNARLISNEGMTQLETIFSKGPLAENPEKLTDMLEQYLSKGEISFGSGVVRDKKGNIVMKDGKPQKVDYVQFPINDIVSTALSDFKADAKLELLGKDPRFTEVAVEVKNFTHLDSSEIDTAQDLLYDIKYYNGYRLMYGTRKANKITGGKDVYQKKIKQYLEIINSRMPNDEPKILTKSQLEATTFKDVKGPSIFRQLEIIFNNDR